MTDKTDTPIPLNEAWQMAMSHHQDGRLPEAEVVYKQILKLHPNHSDALHLLGVIASQVGKYAIAVELIGKSLVQNAGNAAAHSNLGNALRELGRIDEAITHCEHAIALQPDLAEAHNNLGNALIEQGRLDEAIDRYEHAIALKPDFALAHNNLGSALQEVGRIDEAIGRYEHAIALKPDYAEAHRHLAAANFETGQSVEQTATIEALLASGVLTKDKEVHLHFALGNLYADGKEYGRAFENYELGNRIKASLAPFDTDKASRHVDQLIEAFSRDFFDSVAVCGHLSELPVFIVGMPRSGTTLVEQIVSNHPEVCGAGELDFFQRTEMPIDNRIGASTGYPRCVSGLEEQTAKQICTEYLDCLTQVSKSTSRITDKMPSNFLSLGLISVLFPNARVIHCRRNPLDTCLSNYFQHFITGNLYSYDLHKMAVVYRDYARLMGHWRNVLSIQLIEVDYEALVHHQEKESRRLIDFMGLDWSPHCLEFYNNERAVRTASSLAVRQPMYTKSVDRWKNYKPYIDVLLEALGAVEGASTEDERSNGQAHPPG
jgi:tetratricopeptide (TPR) repeat protein